MIRRPPRSTRTDTLFPTRRSSDLQAHRLRRLERAVQQRVFVEDEFQRREHRHALRQIRPDEIHLRSEEHTSELQSLMRISYAVFCLKKTTLKPNLKLYTHTKQ